MREYPDPCENWFCSHFGIIHATRCSRKRARKPGDRRCNHPEKIECLTWGVKYLHILRSNLESLYRRTFTGPVREHPDRGGDHPENVVISDPCKNFNSTVGAGIFNIFSYALKPYTVVLHTDLKRPVTPPGVPRIRPASADRGRKGCTLVAPPDGRRFGRAWRSTWAAIPHALRCRHSHVLYGTTAVLQPIYEIYRTINSLHHKVQPYLMI